MTQYRDHRRLLDESMETLVTIQSRAELIAHLQKSWPFSEDKYKDVYDLSKITVESYSGPDKRIGWKDTWIVHLDGFGVLGFTDGPLP